MPLPLRLLARIRNETFASLGELNRRLFELTEIINTRPMRAYKASRRELFERLDKPALGPLPAEPFQASSWKEVRLNIDYHIDFDHHLYSAPHALLRQELWVRATASSLEIFHLGARVACHVRSSVRGGRTTSAEHMPSTHRAHAEWTPSRILGWAETVGQNTRGLCDVILRERRLRAPAKRARALAASTRASPYFFARRNNPRQERFAAATTTTDRSPSLKRKSKGKSC